MHRWSLNWPKTWTKAKGVGGASFNPWHPLPRGVLRPRTLCVSPRDLAKKIRPFTYRRKYKLVQGFKGESPMLRSGFVLAGANHPNSNPNNDGYLTAAEAAELQLEGT